MADVAREPDSETCVVPDAPAVPGEFGLRVTWQSEEECIEAAQFLIATRLQEDVRRRVAKKALDLREQNRERLFTFAARRTGD